MAAPTLLDYVQSTWSGTGTSETTAANLDWTAAGDVIVCLGCTEDNGITLTTPTATGLTLAALSGSPTTTASSCKGYGWSATAAGSGSSALSSNLNGNNAAGLAAWAFAGVSSLVVPTPVVSAALTMSMTVAQDSSVLMVLGDWNATTDVTVDTSPAGGTLRVAQATSGATFLVVEWHNQAAGTRGYGVANWTGTGTITKFATEVRGVASAAASYVARRRLDMGALIQV